MLEQLGMIGVSWRQGSPSSLSELALPEEATAARLRDFAERHALDELAYLATCNRIELIFSKSAATRVRDLRPQVFELLTGRRPENGEAERRLKAWEGEGAAEHLFLIAAGLDSACVGETEIVGQVRQCYERAAAMGLTGPALEVVFEEAQRIAARVRDKTRLGEGRVSLAEIAVDRLRRHVIEHDGVIAMLGVSPMIERAAVSLQAVGAQMLFVNRTAAKAEALAQRFGARHLSLEAFAAAPPPITALMSATGAPGTVLERDALERIVASSGSALLVIDMAVPADIDPAACDALGIEHVSIDAIVAAAEHNRAARILEAAQAREQVDEALEKLQERYAEIYYGPLLGALQRRYKRTAEEGLKRLLKKELKGLGDEERMAINNWCEMLARRFAHIPSLGLRGLVHSGPEGSVEAFLSRLEPEFADELRSALREKRSEPVQ